MKLKQSVLPCAHSPSAFLYITLVLMYEVSDSEIETETIVATHLPLRTEDSRHNYKRPVTDNAVSLPSARALGLGTMSCSSLLKNVLLVLLMFACSSVSKLFKK